MAYEIIQIDWNNNDCTDNDGESTLTGAIQELTRMCMDSTAKGIVIEITADGEEIERAYVAAPGAVGEIEDYRETLRAAMFGDDVPSSWSKEELEDVEQFIQWGLDNLNDDGWWINKDFVISDRPVVAGDHFPIVFSEQTVRDALFDVFKEEVKE